MKKTIDNYLAEGFDPKAAAYFANGRKRIVDVKARPDFTLRLRFDNGEARLYDMRPLLKKGTVFEPLAKPELFRRVYIDAEHSIAWDIDPRIDSDKVWSNKINLSSDGCYMDSVPLKDGGKE